MPSTRSVSHLAVATHVLLLLAFFLVGCSSSLAPLSGTSTNALTGNWQVSSMSTTGIKLPMLSGELTGSATAVTGIFHAASTGACVTRSTAISLTGHADTKNVLTLTGALAGGTLTISGNVAEDGKSLTGTTYNVTGGTCAFSAPVMASAQAFSSVTGTYAGSFSDAGGNVIDITANLTQTPESDTSGNFQLSGSGTFPNNPCFSSPVTVSNAQVTGGSFTLTYADSSTQNSVTATGTFSSDASTLTVTNWTLTGSCGPDSGTGLLTRQP
jgi:hypothetical protein